MTQVQGLDAALRRMRAIPDKVRQAAAMEMERTATEVVDKMKSIAPLDDGDLINSIHWRWSDRERLMMVIMAGGGGVFYVRYQEFGTADMPANPFFYPVWRLYRRRWRVRITRAIRRALQKV